MRGIPEQGDSFGAHAGELEEVEDARLTPELLFFKRVTIHGTPEILEEPFVVFSIDTPRRDPKDIIFVNPEDGTPEEFIQSQRLY